MRTVFHKPTQVLLFALVGLVGFAACSPSARLSSTPSSHRSRTVAPRASSSELSFRRDIASVANNYLGIPYAYGAKGPRSYDCSGFTAALLGKFNLVIVGNSMSQAKQGQAVRTRDARPGDLVYFTNPRGQVNHVAVVVANGSQGLEVVHATTSRGVVRDNITHSSYWAPRLAGARDVGAAFSAVAQAY